MKNLLAIDTTTEIASLALWIDGCLLQKTQEGARSHAQLILPLIQDLLSEAGIRIDQLDGIVFGRGPGSFTGLRVACSVAKGLAYAQDLPLFPVSSLAAIAEETASQKPLLAMLDARMNQVYWAYFSKPYQSTEERVSFIEEIDIKEDTPLILAGVGFQTYESRLPPQIAARLIDKMVAYPSASAMIRIALSGHISPVTPAQASPVYVRNQITQGESRG